jgi:hypothetical protein
MSNQNTKRNVGLVVLLIIIIAATAGGYSYYENWKYEYYPEHDRNDKHRDLE